MSMEIQRNSKLAWNITISLECSINTPIWIRLDLVQCGNDHINTLIRQWQSFDSQITEELLIANGRRQWSLHRSSTNEMPLEIPIFINTTWAYTNTYSCRWPHTHIPYYAVSLIRKRALFIRRYTRNLVDAGNGKFNLMIVCWGEGHGSAIHDHAGTHCFMKMLQGELREIRYDWPTVVDDQIDGCPNADIACQPDANGEYNSEELNEISRATMELNSVRYINGKYFMTNYAIPLYMYSVNPLIVE